MLPSGELTGFDVDITKALCAEMAATCEIVNQSFDGLIPALNATKIDAIVASMSITPDRLEAIDFAGPYYTVPALFIAPKDSGIEISPKASTASSSASSAARPWRTTSRPTFPTPVSRSTTPRTPPTSISPAAGSTWSSRISVVLQDFLATPDGAGFEAVGEPVYDAEVLGTGAGIGLRKGETELKDKFDAALAAIIASGEYQTINDKYMEREHPAE